MVETEEFTADYGSDLSDTYDKSISRLHLWLHQYSGSSRNRVGNAVLGQALKPLFFREIRTFDPVANLPRTRAAWENESFVVAA
jgi:hypothetical protein